LLAAVAAEAVPAARAAPWIKIAPRHASSHVLLRE
jgi:hypothetical protein